MSKAMLHDLGYVIKRSRWLALAGLCLFMILIPFSTAALPENTIFNVQFTHQQLKFRFMNESAVPAVYYLTALLGMLSAFSVFRFMSDKRETTIFYALCLTREEMFITRLVVGGAMIIICVWLPMLVSLILNIIALGRYPGLTAAFFYISCGLTLTGLASFLISGAACCLTGTMGEAVFCSFGLLAAPSVVCYGLNLLINDLCWGSSFGKASYLGTVEYRQSLINLLAGFNPLLFFRSGLENHNLYYRSLTQAYPDGIDPSFLIWWLAAIAAGAFATGVLFRRRKTENAGLGGSCRWLSSVLAGVFALGVFAFLLDLLFDISRVFAWLFAALGFLAVAAASGHGGPTDAGKWRKRLLRCGIMAGVQCLILLCVYISGAVSVSRVLKNDSAVSASISYVGMPGLISGEMSGSSSEKNYYAVSSVTVTSPGEIDAVKELHRSFAETGKMPEKTDKKNFQNTVIPYDVSITYTYPNGRESVWYYDRASLGQLAKLLSLDDMQSVRDAQLRLFSGEGGCGLASEAYANGDIFITDPFYRSQYKLNLDAAERGKLLQALGADIAAGSVEDRYYPGSLPRAVIMFSRSAEYDLEHFSYNLNNAVLFIPDSYTNTLEYLERNGMLQALDGAPEIESITLQRFDPNGGINPMTSPLSMFFMSYISDSLDDFMIQKDFGEPYAITDGEKLEELENSLRSSWFLDTGGYFAAVKTSGSDKYVYMFIPASLTPEFVSE